MSLFSLPTFNQLLTEVNEYLINESSKSTLTEADQKCLQEFAKGLSLSVNRAQRRGTPLPLTFPKNTSISKNLTKWFKAQDEKLREAETTSAGSRAADGREPEASLFCKLNPISLGSETILSNDCHFTQEFPPASQPEGSNSGVQNDQNALNDQTASEVQSTQVPLFRSKRPLETHNPPETNAKRSKKSANLPPLLTFHVDRLLELVNGREDLSEAVKLLKDSLKVMALIGNIRLALWHLDYLKKMCPNDAAILEAVDFVKECLEARDELELE